MQRQKLIIVIGLPGSGKTTYIKKLLAQNKNIIAFDDFFKGSEVDKPKPSQSPSHCTLIEVIEAGCSVVVSDIVFCIPERFSEFLEYIHTIMEERDLCIQIVCQYFANDPESCMHNIKFRNRISYIADEIRFIKQHEKHYNIPENANCFNVVRA